MSLNINALSTWTDETSAGLVKEILLKATTINGADLVAKRYGLKGNSVKLNTVKSTINASSILCGFVSTGSTILNQASLDLCPIKFQDSICLETLEQYWYSWEMENQYNTESLGSFESMFLDNKTEYIAKELDKIAWRGAKSASAYVSGLTGNLLLCDGFLQNAAELSASTVNVTKSALTVSNAYAVVDAIMAVVPAEIIEDVTLFMSPADFQIYLTSLRGLNLFNYNTESKGVEAINHPGSIGLTVKRTNGLAGVASGTFLATQKDNIVLGLSDAADLDFKTWYSQDNQELRLSAKIKMGTAFFFPELVVVVR
jgi:hypothetical protein